MNRNTLPPPSRARIALLLCCAAALSRAEAFVNSKAIPRACDSIWPTMVSTLIKNGFAPSLSDRLGGVLTAQYTRGPSLYRGARTDMDAFTIRPFSRWVAVEKFKVESITATVTQAPDNCLVTLQVQYAALRNNLAENGWVEMESNGRLEWMILAEIDHLASASAPSTLFGDPSRPGSPEQTLPPRDEKAKGKGIVVRFTSTPTHAEVEIDGEYWGTTPTADLTRLPEGSHTLVVKKPGYKLWERKINLASGDDRTISAELDLEPVDPTKPRVVGNDSRGQY
jgi:hypothetical protein